MEITAWRITLARHADAAFDGEGARRYGGRFNSEGTPMIYTASMLSLALLEMLVHVDRERALAQYVAIPVTFEAKEVLALDQQILPEGWNAPASTPAVQEIGNLWIASRASLVLRVPSVLLPDAVAEREHNYLINPLHEHVDTLQIGAAHELAFDRRLLG